jgi:hypothetical protein
MRRFVVLLVALSVGVATSAEEPPAAEEPASSKIEIYVTPFYNSEGPTVRVGPFSEELQKADATTILDVAKAMQAEKPSLPAVSMTVLAIRMYDLGQKDEAVYWFYAGQFRARLFGLVLDESRLGGIGEAGFETKHAHAAFQQLAGTYINGYAFGDIPKLVKTLERVRAEETAAPDFAKIYPGVAFIDPADWEAKREEIDAGLAKLIAYVTDNADEIRRERRKNGIEGRY